MTPRLLLLSCLALFLSSCDRKQAKAPAVNPEITVAAAANLTGVFDQIGKEFTGKTGTKVVFSYASTAQLAQQIANSAPFDVFAAADTEHVDSLIKSGKLNANSRRIYARGALALWIPKGDAAGIVRMDDLASSKARSIAIASPSAAPYGKAALEALQRTGLWSKVEPKVVYATNISMAKQFASTGNVDAAFTALSLVIHEGGRTVRIDPTLYHPLDQAAGILTQSPKQDAAAQFLAFLSSQRGRAILQTFGYSTPAD